MDASGGELDQRTVHDPEKVAKYFKKNNWDMPGGPPGYDYNKGAGNNQYDKKNDRENCESFQSGLKMFKDELIGFKIHNIFFICV